GFLQAWTSTTSWGLEIWGWSRPRAGSTRPKELRLGAFAQHRIRGAITDSLRRLDPVSRCLRSQQKTAERATTELMTNLGRCPTEAETARRLRLSLRRWRRLRWKLYAAGCPVESYRIKGALAQAVPDKLPGTWADPERLADLAETRQILD